MDKEVGNLNDLNFTMKDFHIIGNITKLNPILRIGSAKN